MMASEILDVDLLAFERATGEQRRAVVDGVRAQPRDRVRVHAATTCPRTCSTRPTACSASSSSSTAETKQQFIAPGANGQTGYTGLLVETAASSDKPDWKEMLNWSSPIAAGHPLKRKFPTAYPDQVLPEAAVPGHHRGAVPLPRVDRRPAASVPAGDRRGHRLPRDVLRRHGAATARRSPGRSATRRWRELGDDGHVWAAEHGDINLITALPRATAPGLQVKVDDDWVDAVAARRRR